jgi:hypothetical protein
MIEIFAKLAGKSKKTELLKPVPGYLVEQMDKVRRL